MKQVRARLRRAGGLEELAGDLRRAMATLRTLAHLSALGEVEPSEVEALVAGMTAALKEDR